MKEHTNKNKNASYLYTSTSSLLATTMTLSYGQPELGTN